MRPAHPAQYDESLKRNEVLPLALTQTNPENVVLSERNQTQKPHVLSFCLYEMSRRNKFVSDRQYTPGCQGLGKQVMG